MSSKTRDWLIALGYVALIYATLEVARFPLAFLRAHGWLRLSLGFLFFLSSVGIISIFFQRHGFSLWRFVFLSVIAIVYFHLSKHTQTPEEQVHFFEYGLVGIFFLRAVSHSLKSNGSKYFLAWLLASLAGWIDELLQGLTPHRHYDIQDVKLNAISAALGLFICFLYQTNKTHR